MSARQGGYPRRLLEKLIRLEERVSALPLTAEGIPGPAGPPGADGVGLPGPAGHSPVHTWGTAADSDRILIDGLATGPHLTGPAVEGLGGAAWGEITGTLAEQTDLGSALAGKAATAHAHAPGDVTGTAVVNEDPRLTDARTPTIHDHPGLYEVQGAVAAHLVAQNHALLHSNSLDHARQHSITATADHTFPGGATFLRADGVFAAPSGGADPWTIVKLANDFTTSATANTNVTGLSFTPAAGKTYIVYGGFMLRTATATVGARPGIAWPTVEDGAAWVDAPNSLTAAAVRIWGARTTQNAASTGLADTASSHYAKLEALIVAGASPSGNFQITLASETAGTIVRMRTGSYIMYREI